MTRPAAVAAIFMVTYAGSLRSQDIEPRIADYGFTTTVDDARAIWLNPAGLAALTEASIMGELVLTRPIDEAFGVGQWTVGFNSRGFSFGYQKDQHPFLGSADAVRLGFGLGFSLGSVGMAVTSYSSNDSAERGVDLGARLDPAPGIVLAGVVRHVGRPVVRTIPLPVTGALGASWTPMPTHLQLAGEAIATERAGAATTGYDLSYRAGGRLSTRGRIPVGVLTALDLGSNFRIDRWAVGVVLGGSDQVVAVGSVAPLVGRQHLYAASVTGVASRRSPGRQF